VRALYAVERQGKDASIADRLKLRREQSAPLLAQLHDRLLQWKQQLLPKHPMAEAMNVFCSDGAVPIDNNVSEREMKRVVLNRKNSLFLGNVRGGKNSRHPGQSDQRCSLVASSRCRRMVSSSRRFMVPWSIPIMRPMLFAVGRSILDRWSERSSRMSVTGRALPPTPAIEMPRAEK
jgi:hypothetical protein